jgi:hypothetical protein
LKGYAKAKSRTEERELAQTERPLTATEYGIGGNPFVAFVIFCKKFRLHALCDLLSKCLPFAALREISKAKTPYSRIIRG